MTQRTTFRWINLIFNHIIPNSKLVQGIKASPGSSFQLHQFCLKNTPYVSRAWTPLAAPCHWAPPNLNHLAAKPFWASQKCYVLNTHLQLARIPSSEELKPELVNVCYANHQQTTKPLWKAHSKGGLHSTSNCGRPHAKAMVKIQSFSSLQLKRNGKSRWKASLRCQWVTEPCRSMWLSWLIPWIWVSVWSSVWLWIDFTTHQFLITIVIHSKDQTCTKGTPSPAGRKFDYLIYQHSQPTTGLTHANRPPVGQTGHILKLSNIEFSHNRSVVWNSKKYCRAPRWTWLYPSLILTVAHLLWRFHCCSHSKAGANQARTETSHCAWHWLGVTQKEQSKASGDIISLSLLIWLLHASSVRKSWWNQTDFLRLPATPSTDNAVGPKGILLTIRVVRDTGPCNKRSQWPTRITVVDRAASARPRAKRTTAVSLPGTTRLATPRAAERPPALLRENLRSERSAQSQYEIL